MNSNDKTNPIEQTSNMTTMGTFGLAATINALRKDGYREDFNLDPKDIDDDFVIDHVYRFDVWTDPADQAVLYALRSKRTGEKGILVNGYGIYSDSKNNSTIQNVERWKDGHHDNV